MSSFLRLREFRERYISSEFSDSSFATQVQAGWYNWFCPDSELAGRLAKLWDEIISRITDDRVFDAYTIHFCNVCPASDHPLFDRIYLNRFDSDYGLCVDIDDKRNDYRFKVNTSESTAFSSDSVEEALDFIKKELEDHLQTENKVRATRAQVYKPFYSSVPELNTLDATNGGISGKESSVFVEDPHGQDLIAADDPRLMRIVPDAIGNDCHLEPVNGHKGKGYTDWMDGGNIAELRKPGWKTVYYRIHDRQDTWKAYEILSH